MSTRSVIAVEDSATKTVKAIYCHHDGYVLGGVGETLYEYYQDNAKIAALIELGSLSSLGKYVAPADGMKHDFDNPAKDVTVAYHRDRQEEYHAPIEYENAQTLLETAGDEYWAEYAYLWRDGEWLVGSPFEPKNGFVTVESVL